MSRSKARAALMQELEHAMRRASGLGAIFSQAVADSAGRVLAGTMPTPGGSARLYRFDLHGNATLLLDDVGQSNGMVFSGLASCFPGCSLDGM